VYLFEGVDVVFHCFKDGITAQIPPLLRIDFHYELKKRLLDSFTRHNVYMPIYTILHHIQESSSIILHFIDVTGVVQV